MHTKVQLTRLILVLSIGLVSCSPRPVEASTIEQTNTPTADTHALVTATTGGALAESPTPTETITFTPAATTLPTTTPTLPLVTATPAPDATATPTATVTPIPTATWTVAGPGEVVAPILMYHHIDPANPSPRYNIQPEVFARQMQALADWGYHTITAAQLAQAVTTGTPLPERPIVITFDDGNYSVYEYAFPIMQAHGFVGVTYIVTKRLQAAGFTGVPELQEMIAAGWEVGSHTYSHADLTLNHSTAFNEILNSCQDLSEALGSPVTSLAYPFGASDPYLRDRAKKWGITNAMGLGIGWTHNQASLYYLQRIEIKRGMNMRLFASLLPWSSPP